MTEPIVDAAPALDFDLKSLPKVSLHDHLDGGLRPATIIELAEAVGHTLPSTDPTALGEWFRESADSGSLVRYLETFDHTVAVMQTKEGLFRVAKEFVEDLADDGVVYGEVRWAPEQHLQQGLTLDEVVEAVQEGLEAGVDAVAETGREIQVGQLITAMRHADRGQEIAELAVRHRDKGAVGLRHRRRRRRLPALPLPGRLHLPGREQLPGHRPRRRSRRTGQHPVRPGRRPGPAPGPRRPHRRGHHGRVRRDDDADGRRRATTSAWSPSATSPAGSATAASPWKSARPPTCRPAPLPASARASKATRWTCSTSWASTSPSTPTTAS